MCIAWQQAAACPNAGCTAVNARRCSAGPAAQGAAGQSGCRAGCEPAAAAELVCALAAPSRCSWRAAKHQQATALSLPAALVADTEDLLHLLTPNSCVKLAPLDLGSRRRDTSVCVQRASCTRLQRQSWSSCAAAPAGLCAAWRCPTSRQCRWRYQPLASGALPLQLTAGNVPGLGDPGSCWHDGLAVQARSAWLLVYRVRALDLPSAPPHR